MSRREELTNEDVAAHMAALTLAEELVSGAPAKALVRDWWSRAAYAYRLRPGTPWPAWSIGEVLAVALILGDSDRLAAMDYTPDQVLDRLRYDLGEHFVLPLRPLSMEDAAKVFARLSEAVQ